jgi:hypothetical protein
MAAVQEDVCSMNAWMRPFGYWCLLAALPPALGQQHAALVSADDLKAALHDVLSHNSLFDSSYLSDRLGIGLRISRPEPAPWDSDTTRFEGIATANPPLLYGSIEYAADMDRSRKTSTARLTFGSRGCAALQEWGSQWHVPTQYGQSTDGGPGFESLVWPGDEGISLSLTRGPTGCYVVLSQTVRRLVDMTVSPRGPLASASGLSGQIADLLLSDLRDYTKVGRILSTEFVLEPDAQRNGLLTRGRPFPSRVIPRFKPYTFYDGDDSGWYMPPSFFARPLHIADKGVTLQLSPDGDALCLTQGQLASDLQRRGHQIRKERSRDGEESIYSVRSANLVRVTVDFKDGCATALNFRQVTDVTHSLGDPIRFTLQDSLDQSNSTLTGAAQRRIDLLASRLRSVSLGGIEIEEIPVGAAIEGSDLAQLKQLIAEELKRKRLDVPARAKTEEVGQCGVRLQPDEPAICVDVWQ